MCIKLQQKQQQQQQNVCGNKSWWRLDCRYLYILLLWIWFPVLDGLPLSALTPLSSVRSVDSSWEPRSTPGWADPTFTYRLMGEQQGLGRDHWSRQRRLPVLLPGLLETSSGPGERTRRQWEFIFTIGLLQQGLKESKIWGRGGSDWRSLHHRRH